MERRMTQAHPIRFVQDVGFVRELEFEIVDEPWARYQLKDGGMIKHRSIVVHIHEVLKVDPNDPNPSNPTQFVAQLNPNGEKLFWVNATSVVSWSP